MLEEMVDSRTEVNKVQDKPETFSGTKNEENAQKTHSISKEHRSQFEEAPNGQSGTI